MEQVNKNIERKSRQANIIAMEKGKLPPQALELEEAVLGAMLIDKGAVDTVIDIIHPDVFYKESHQKIYKAIFTLFQNSQPIDILTVSEQLRKDANLDSAGGDYYLVHLSQKVASTAHVEYHARIVLEKYIKRSLISISGHIEEESFDETTDVFEVLDGAESKLFEVSQGNLKKSTEDAKTLVSQAIKRIEDISKKEGMSGVPSGFEKIDAVTSGWQNSDLIIIAARPGMGKTAFVLSMAKNIGIRFNMPVAIFSLEMSSVQLITRMISSETGLTSEKLRKANLQPHEWEQLNVKVKNLSNAPIWIDDTPSLSIFDLRAKARRLVSQHDVKVIIVDYLQLMTSGANNKGGGNREQEISIISRNLKALAKELNVPVITLSQLSREVEKRGGTKRPILSDLRESGSIEQDADIVSFIYRPEYYGFNEWEDEERTPSHGQAEFIIAKHRNGSLENVRLKFEGHLAQFSDLEEGYLSTSFMSKMNETNTEIPDSAKNIDPNDAFDKPQSADDDMPF